jgi:hypothetical protein
VVVALVDQRLVVVQQQVYLCLAHPTQVVAVVAEQADLVLLLADLVWSLFAIHWFLPKRKKCQHIQKLEPYWPT